MTRQTEPAYPPIDHLQQGSPLNVTQNESMQRIDVVADLATALTTQVMTSVAVPMRVGDLATNISFISGATAASVPTNWWFALYSPAGALISQTADQATGAWAADTVKTLPLVTPFLVTAGHAIYYVGIMMKATTTVSLLGLDMKRVGASTGVASVGHKVLCQTSGSALTTTAPGTIATPTTVSLMPYCLVS